MVNFPPLTILEEFLLLTLEDEAGNLNSLPFGTMNYAAAAAVMMDLTYQGRIDNDILNSFVVDKTPLDDDILDPVLRVMSVDPILTSKPTVSWLERFADEGEGLRERAMWRLQTRGIIRREDKKVLWVLGTRRYAIRQHDAVLEVKSRLLAKILNGEVVDLRDKMLVTLADACGWLCHVLTSQELARVTPRINEIADEDMIGQAATKAISEIEAAIAITVGFR